MNTYRGQQKQRIAEKYLCPGCNSNPRSQCRMLEVNTHLGRATNGVGVRDDRTEKEFW
jgi:hypothetical protein